MKISHLVVAAGIAVAGAGTFVALQPDTMSSNEGVSGLDAAGIAIVASAQAQAPPKMDKDSIVKTSLLADTTAVEPGTTFTLGVLFEMQPDWHIYWKNPGGSGFATTVQWGLPPGASSSGTLYPAPVNFESPGPVVSYGYEKQVLLMVEARAAKLPENGQVQITAKSRWLMCSDRCIPNSKELTLTLPVGEGKPANQEVFNKYRSLLPKAVGDLPDNVKLSTTMSGSTTNYTMTVTPPEGKKLLAAGEGGVYPVYFFPTEAKDYVIEPPTVEGTITEAGALKVYDGPVTVKWKAEPSNETAEPLKRLSGVLVYQSVTGTAPDQPTLLQVDRKL